ncbi:LCP family protein [Synechococcus sp. PCC 6312]|uniref:LCP family protein n=1 Tax=Synechococcus sp. (strain ATCC 27167 / PCC 6312) TaxID=195253 RepID=UPI000301517B|nr:LCP family protein [Synechococcus sp. PCC 6312]
MAISSKQRASRSSRSPRTAQAMAVPRKNRSPWSWLGWGVAFATVSAVSLGLGMSLSLMTPSRQSNGELSGGWGQLFGRGFQYGLARPINVLIMGVDLEPNAQGYDHDSLNGRSDTMLLARLNPDHNSVTVLTIPRDSRVEIPGYGMQKINAANAFGGAPLATQVVSHTLNYVPVDRYIRISTQAFRELVDLIGGVEVNVPVRMQYTDNTQKLFIDLQPGLQTLNGDQAEGFVRFRHDGLGDIGRAQRQQILLKALQKKISNPLMLAKLPQLYQVMQQYMDTDLSFGEMMAILQFGLGTSSKNINMLLLPGQFSGDGYDASYWLPNYEAIDRLVARHFFEKDASWSGTETVDPKGLKIAIQNATDSDQAGQVIVDFLMAQNYRNVYMDSEWSHPVAKTQVIAQQGDREAAVAMLIDLGLGRVAKELVEVDATGSFGSDITIRIGSDWRSFVPANF